MSAFVSHPIAGQRPSHRALLVESPAVGGPVSPDIAKTLVDAVIVPAYRPVQGLDHAADVAAEAGAALVVMCSGHVTAEAAVRHVVERQPELQAVAVDIARSGGSDMGFVTATHAEGTYLRRHDACDKRNLGLLLARLMGWRQVMLLNDDVRGLDRDRLVHCRDLLGGMMRKVQGSSVAAAAGWAFSDFPDNSVVCHAQRLAGGCQDTFVSDGALMLDVTARTGFFPPLYNEDWLFLFDAVRHGAVAMAGEDLRQLPYNPFAQTRRAEAEEFGDVLGEGLYTLLHEPRLGDADDLMTDPEYWRHVVAQRRQFIVDVIARLDGAGRRGTRWSEMRSCLRAALRRHGEHWPTELAEWVRAWRGDLERWHDRLSALEPVGDLPAALEELSLTANAHTSASARYATRVLA